MGDRVKANLHIVGTLHDPDGGIYEIRGARDANRSFGRMFNVTFPDALAEIARTITSGATVRVLLALPSHLGWSDFRPLPREVLAKELDMEGPTVSRALVDLQKRGLIERQGTGPVTTWKLSPTWGWVGTPDAYHKAVREQAEARKAAAEAAKAARACAGKVRPVPAPPGPPAPAAAQSSMRLLAVLEGADSPDQ